MSDSVEGGIDPHNQDFDTIKDTVAIPQMEGEPNKETYVLQASSSMYNPNTQGQRSPATYEHAVVDIGGNVGEVGNTLPTVTNPNFGNEVEVVETALEEEVYTKKSLDNLLETPMKELFFEGFRYDLEAKLLFYKYRLYRHVLIENLIYYFIMTPYLIVQSAAIAFFIFTYQWEYLPIFGGVCQIIALVLFIMLVLVGPLWANSFIKISEKAEEALDGRDNDLEDDEYNEASTNTSFTCSPYCMLTAYTIWGTYTLEFVILIIPILILVILCIIVFPIGIPIISFIQAFGRVWEAFRVVLIRRHGIMGYLELYKLFFLNFKLFPFLMGMGYGFCCAGRRRGCRQYFCVVSATKFYWQYLEDGLYGDKTTAVEMEETSVPPNPPIQMDVVDGEAVTAQVVQGDGDDVHVNTVDDDDDDDFSTD